MKKFLLLLAFILPMACSFVSCGSDDEPKVTELTEKEIQMFQGSWDIVKAEPTSFPGKLKLLVSGSNIVMFQKLPE